MKENDGMRFTVNVEKEEIISKLKEELCKRKI